MVQSIHGRRPSAPSEYDADEAENSRTATPVPASDTPLFPRIDWMTALQPNAQSTGRSSRTTEPTRYLVPLMTCSTASLRAREDWIGCLARKDSAHGCVSHCRLTPFVASSCVFLTWKVRPLCLALRTIHAVLRCGVVGCQGSVLFLDAVIREG